MKILYITYYFPPLGGAGVQRALKFAKYLPEFGIQPVVIAADDESYVHDSTLLQEISTDLHVERVRHSPLLGRALALKRRWTRSQVKVREVSPASSSPLSTAVWKQKFKDKILNFYLMINIPDDKSRWSARFYQRACQLVHDQDIDLIFATAPPYSALRLAVKISKKTGRPWVADYRDLWVGNPSREPPFWRQYIDRVLENRWLSSARGIVAVTPTMQRTLAKNPKVTCPIACIPNGYDESDFINQVAKKRRGSAIRFVHVGTFYGKQSPIPFLQGVAKYLDANPKRANDLVISFVGVIGERFTDAIEEFNRSWPHVLERTGVVQHSEAIKAMLSADVLLLVIGGGEQAKGVLTGKIFEYMRCDRPILLMGPSDGDAAEILRAQNYCTFVREDDIEGVARVVNGFMAKHGLQSRAERARPEIFERRALTQQLANFLAKCMEPCHERA